MNTFPLDEAQCARLESAAPLLDVRHRGAGSSWSPEDLDAEVVLASRPPERAATPNLRWLQLGSAGVEHLRADGWIPDGAIVTNAAGVYAVPVAEYVLAAILDAAQCGRRRRAGQASRTWLDAYAVRGRLLRGATLLVVGFGAIGREIARLADGFGMRVLAFNTTGERRQPPDRFREPGTGDPGGTIPERVEPIDALPAFAQEADFLVCCLPATPRTANVVDERLLAALPEHAWVVNVGRGNAVDLHALGSALADGAIAGAVVDVLEREPLPAADPLWDVPGLVLTPHVSGHAERWDVVTELAAENLLRYSEGRPLLNVVDLAAGY